jgi:hypothetical protein
MWIYTSTPHMPSWCSAYLVKHRDSFTSLPFIIKLYIVHRSYVITGSDPTNQTYLIFFYSFIYYYILTEIGLFVLV